MPSAVLEGYSSAGDTPILFADNGERLRRPIARYQPRLVGPDGVNTTFFYADTSLDSDSWPNFFGTSAAVPHAAGVAALLKSANGALTPAEIYAALEGTAADMGTPDFDFFTGYGFIQADRAIDRVAAAASGASAHLTIATPPN